jgi:hypothetical protein
MSALSIVKEPHGVERGLGVIMGTAGVTADQFVKRTPAVKVLLLEET